MGLMVSHHDHHRHSAYLMANVDAPGFSQSQQRRIGALVLGQRGGLRKLDTTLDKDGFAWQVLCLRLAVIACHAREPVAPRDLMLHAAGAEARLGWKAAWADRRERTLYLLHEEAAAWQRHGPLRLSLPAA
jgi:exopolyphosphatase/guanosine-5'-triphosphate,3'-diphosphate pyrophosphatase